MIFLAVFLLLAGVAAGIWGIRESRHAVVEVSWETASSLDVIGYRIYRSGPSDLSPELLNNPPVAPALDPYQSNDVVYRDTSALPGVEYRYQVETLKRDGSTTLSSPLTVRAEAQGSSYFWLAAGLLTASLSFILIFHHPLAKVPGAAA